jgi:hypothetical protein
LKRISLSSNQIIVGSLIGCHLGSQVRNHPQLQVRLCFLKDRSIWTEPIWHKMVSGCHCRVAHWNVQCSGPSTFPGETFRAKTRGSSLSGPSLQVFSLVKLATHDVNERWDEASLRVGHEQSCGRRFEKACMTILGNTRRAHLEMCAGKPVYITFIYIYLHIYHIHVYAYMLNIYKSEICIWNIYFDIINAHMVPKLYMFMWTRISCASIFLTPSLFGHTA